MRRAELVMAATMAVFSLYLMWKSAEPPPGPSPAIQPTGSSALFHPLYEYFL